MSELDASEFDGELLSAYLDNELTPAERAGVEERLRTDERARRMVAELREASAAVRGLPRVAVGRDLAGRVLAAIEQERPATGGRIEAASLRSMQEATSPRHSGRTTAAGRTWAWGALAVAAALMVMAMWPAGDRRDDRQVAQTEPRATQNDGDDRGGAGGDKAVGEKLADDADTAAQIDALAEAPVASRAIEARSPRGAEGSAVTRPPSAPSSGRAGIESGGATQDGSALRDSAGTAAGNRFAEGGAGGDAPADTPMGASSAEPAESLAAAPLEKDQEDAAAVGGLNAGLAGAPVAAGAAQAAGRAQGAGPAPRLEQWSDELGANLVRVAPGGVATLERALAELQIDAGGQEALPREVASQWIAASDGGRGAADADAQETTEAILVEATPEAIARLLARLPGGAGYGFSAREPLAPNGAAEAPLGTLAADGSVADALPQQTIRGGRSWRLVRRATTPDDAAPAELARQEAALAGPAAASPRGGGFGGGGASGSRAMGGSALGQTARVLFVFERADAKASPSETGGSSAAAPGAPAEPAAGSRPATPAAEEK